MGTQFASVYNRFLNKITDDMYMELTPEDTRKDLQSLLMDAIPGFEFPRVSLNYALSTSWINSEAVYSESFVIKEEGDKSLVDNSCFENVLTSEEINILAILMVANWLQRQITSIEIIRMKYSGADFKMTSQANHLSRLLALQTEIRRQSLHTQRLYKRRKIDSNGQISSNWSVFSKANYQYKDKPLELMSSEQLEDMIDPFEESESE